MTQPGCCGPIEDRVQLIQTVSSQLSGAHEALAEMYKTLASEMTDENEKEALLKAAANQLELAERSKYVTIPDLLGIDDTD